MGIPEIVPEKPVKEQIREQKRAVDHSRRKLEREKRKLDNQKKKMLTEIKNMSKKGQIVGAKMLAKDIVRATNQSKKLEQFIGQLTAVSMRISSCASLNELQEAMNNAAKAMTTVSNKLDTKKLAALGKELSKENMKLDLKSEMMQDIFDEIGESMESMGNEEDEEDLIRQVLEESEANIGDKKDEMIDFDAEKEKIKLANENNSHKKHLVVEEVVD